MSNQKFSASQREALWLAHEKKCAYTRERLDVSCFHIDHIIPEYLADDPAELERVRNILGLKKNFDLHGYENLLPCRAGANLQKGLLVLNEAHVHFFLAIAESKKKEVQITLEKIERRKISGKALILLQQCLERGELSPSEIIKILEEYNEQPQDIFHLLEKMHFSESEEISKVSKSDIDYL
ncbi:TPA: hypothetical protein SIA35_001843, partial [Aeromonas sobria]|nr:hypothetical protein [Aeromonas sobria]